VARRAPPGVPPGAGLALDDAGAPHAGGPDAPVRTVCLWWPDWPVVAVRASGAAPADGPVVVLDRGRVLAASAAARAEGVRRGMRKREAEARCPAAPCVEVDPAAEARVFEGVARALDAVTARLAVERPGRCSFPARGAVRWAGGDDALTARVHAVAAAASVELGLVVGDGAVGDGAVGDGAAGGGAPEGGGAVVPSAVRVGIADGALAARLAARVARPTHVVPPGAAPGFLAGWPLTALEGSLDGATPAEVVDLADLLARLGVRTLGELAALPAAAVLGRFGPRGLAAHRLAHGLDLHPVDLAEPPPDLVAAHAFDPPVERIEGAVFVAVPLAERFLDRLGSRGLACTAVRVEARTEGGDELVRAWRHDGALTPPALAERVRWQLDGWLLARAAARARAVAVLPDDVDPDPEVGEVGGGLVALRLVPDQLVPARGRQLGLWGGDARTADRAARAFARVQGLLGIDAVVTAVPQGGRLPGERVRWVPWGEEREPERAPDAPWPGAVPPPSPALVHDPPVPATLLDADGRAVGVTARGLATAAPRWLGSDALPGGGGPVHGWAGPWPHDVRWWDPDARTRGALWQVVAGDAACLVVTAQGTAAVVAVYD
jgi:protein ImuB